MSICMKALPESGGSSKNAVVPLDAVLFPAGNSISMTHCLQRWFAPNSFLTGKQISNSGEKFATSRAA